MQKHMVEMASATGNWWSILLGPPEECSKTHRELILGANRKAFFSCPHQCQRMDLRHYCPHASSCGHMREYPALLQSRDKARGI